jgi:hypothetical protein
VTWKAVAAAFVAYLALAVLKTWPLTEQAGTHLTGTRDPLLLAWVLAWDARALAVDPGGLFQANIFHPLQDSLAFSDHLLGLLPLSAPVYAVTGNPVAAYNAVVLLSFALCGASMFCLARAWSGSAAAAALAGLLFAFAPARTGDLRHVALLGFFWAPWALLGLDRYLREERGRDLALFAGAFWLQVLSAAYLAFPVALAAGALVLQDAWRQPRAAFARRRLARWGLFLAASAAVLLPAHLPYLDVHRAWRAERSIEEVMGYTPDVTSLLAPPESMNGLYVRLLSPLARPPSQRLFQGLVLPLLAVAGAFWLARRAPAEQRRLLGPLAGLCVLALVLALGPYLVAFGRRTDVPLPYLAFYHLVPGWSAMRVPGRFVHLATLAGSALAAFGALGLARRLRRPPALVCTALGALFLLELGFSPPELSPAPAGPHAPPQYRWLAEVRPGPIVELPFGRGPDYRAVLNSTAHWLPLVNGRTGYFPPTYAEVKRELGQLPAARAWEYAGALGVRAVVVHAAELPPLEVQRWSAAEARGATRRLATFGRDAVYEVPPVAAQARLELELRPPAERAAGAPVRVELLLRPEGEGAWRQQPPFGLSDAVLSWTPVGGGATFRSRASLLLPLVVRRGEAEPIALTLASPAAAGRYLLELELPGLGLRTAPRPVRLR